MSARYTRNDFKNAGLEPQDCDRIVSEEAGPGTLYMACTYHEGFIDGYEAAKEDR